MNRPVHNYAWPPEAISLLEEHWGSMPTPDIAAMIGYPRWIVSNKAKQLGLPQNKRRRWTKEQEDCIRGNYKTKSNIELANIFNAEWPKSSGKWKTGVIQSVLIKLGLQRTAEEVKYIKGRNILNGSYSGNKGKARPVGSISVWNTISTTAGHARSAGKVIKTLNGWVLHKHYVWEQANGAIPKGYQIECIDGNELNSDISNLRMRKRIESANTVFAGTVMTDKWIAGILTRNDKKDREKLVNEYNHIISNKRKLLELNRDIHETTRQMARGAASDGK